MTSIGDYTFYNCSSLTSITIPNSVTSIGYQAFYGCSGLTSITIPNSVTSIGDQAFYGCSKLTHIYIDDIADWCCSSICGSLMSYGSRDNHLYLNGSEITVLTIPDGVTSIGGYAFKGCSSLISVTIPNSVTSIGYEAFKGCSRMTSVTIGNGVTSIGYYGFYGCSGLTYVTIGENVRDIGDGAFYGCQNIETITSYAVIPPMCKEHTFDSKLFDKTKVYVPNAENTFARYLGNNVWGQFRYIYEKDLTGVDTPVMNSETQVLSLINLNGQYITNAQRGINLQKISNGTTKKVLMR